MPLQRYDPRALRRAVACVQQEPVLFSGSVRENLCYGLEEAPDDDTQQRLIMVMMSRTKERLKVEALRDIATNL